MKVFKDLLIIALMISFAYAAPVTIDEEFRGSPAAGKRNGTSGALKAYMAIMTVIAAGALLALGWALRKVKRISKAAIKPLYADVEAQFVAEVTEMGVGTPPIMKQDASTQKRAYIEVPECERGTFADKIYSVTKVCSNASTNLYSP